MKRLTTKDMILAALFTALTIVGAKINLLFPEIPVTLQPMVVMLSGSLLGSKAALFSQIAYIALGLIGIPVFAKPMAGPAYISSPSFGFLIGFAVGAYIIGRIIEKANKKSLFVFICANMAGLIIFYLFGVLHFYILMNLFLSKSINIIKTLSICVFPFILKDILLGILMSVISYNIYNKVKTSTSRNC